ncbi:Serine/arginine-rich splicing factor 10 [Geranomyces variabilis]|uniref:Serine/arginine-rich splicing factor 10 n=1 Tax=Geranomyces variabilis TaxID=109894 RepID=A0AAD5XRS0_9FUNG|nr:Serine/arginine-rich splicing factor 10 [Geranomyces variabilis]
MERPAEPGSTFMVDRRPSDAGSRASESRDVRERSPERGSRDGGSGGNGDRHQGGRRREGQEEVRSLFVRGLSDGTRSEDLMDAFQNYGNVMDCYLPLDYYTGKARGFAYIQFATQEEADEAFRKIEYITINGRTLTIEWAAGRRKTPVEMRGRGPGSKDNRRRDDRREPRNRSRSGDRYRPRDRRSRSPPRRRRSRTRSRSRSRSPRRDHHSSSKRERYPSRSRSRSPARGRPIVKDERRSSPTR